MGRCRWGLHILSPCLYRSECWSCKELHSVSHLKLCDIRGNTAWLQVENKQVWLYRHAHGLSDYTDQNVSVVVTNIYQKVPNIYGNSSRLQVGGKNPWLWGDAHLLMFINTWVQVLVFHDKKHHVLLLIYKYRKIIKIYCFQFFQNYQLEPM